MATATRTTRPTRTRTATTTKPKETEVAHTLATVPSGVLAKYIGRIVDGGIPDFDVLATARKRRANTLIEGPTGPGKTTFVMAFAEREELPFYAIPSNIGVEPSQLFGKYIPDENEAGKFIWVDGPVTEIVRHGGVLLINEVNFLPERLATVLFGLLDARRVISLLDHKGEVIEAHPDCVVVADMNPDYEGTRRLNKAFRNRFRFQLVWDYDPAVESQLIRSASLLTMANDLRDHHRKMKLATPTSTNSLMEFEQTATDLGIDFAIANFANRYESQDRPAVLTVVRTYRDSIEDDLADDSEDDWQSLRG